MSDPPQAPASSPHPYIHTRSAHNVKLWMKKAKAEGRLKNCWHLGIDKVINRALEDGKVVDEESDFYFVPGCAHHSFESNFAHISDDMQLEILRNSLGNDPVSCPKNCTFYENHKWGWIKNAVRRVFVGLFDTLRGLLKGFVGMAWQTQVALIGLVVLIIAPKWVPLIISLAKAIWGKTP